MRVPPMSRSAMLDGSGTTAGSPSDENEPMPAAVNEFRKLPLIDSAGVIEENSRPNDSVVTLEKSRKSDVKEITSPGVEPLHVAEVPLPVRAVDPEEIVIVSRFRCVPVPSDAAVSRKIERVRKPFSGCVRLPEPSEVANAVVVSRMKR